MIDDHWDDIDGLEFRPWVGPNYYERSIFKIRILVMGESTYLDPSETMEQYQGLRKEYELAYFIEHDILPYRNGVWKTSVFWTKWINGLLGRQMCCLRERQMVLDSVAFWNYADGPPLNLPGTPPHCDDLKRANGKLRKVITKLEPNLVILMSRRLWPNLLKGDDRFAADPNAVHGAVCKDEVGGVKFSFLSICHPRGFSRKRDWCAIRSALEGDWR
jgi:hypothetical protein